MSKAPHLLLFLGPPKAGSTYFWDTLKSHPQVGVAKAKEMFFFDRFYHQGEAWYANQFPEGSTAWLDCSHDYLYSEEALSRVASLQDQNVVAVVVLRDPLERAVSAYHYLRWQGRTELDFPNAALEIDEIFSHADYGRWVPPWQSALGDNLALVDFTRLVKTKRVETFNSILQLAGCADLDESLVAQNRNARRASRLPPVAMRLGRATGEALRSRGMLAAQSRLKDFVLQSKLANRHTASDPLDHLAEEHSLAIFERLQDLQSRFDGVVPDDLQTRWRAQWAEKLQIAPAGK